MGLAIAYQTGACSAEFASCTDGFLFDPRFDRVSLPLENEQVSSDEGIAEGSEPTIGSGPDASDPPSPPLPSAEQNAEPGPVIGDELLNVQYFWYTYTGNDVEANRVSLSPSADSMLDEGLSRMTTNIVNAMSAVYWLLKHPTSSHQLTLSVGLSLTIGGSTTGASLEGTGGGQLSYTATVRSQDEILSALGAANDKIDTLLKNRLESVSSPIAGRAADVALGQTGAMGGHSSAATLFGTLARKYANVEARNIYSRSYRDRGDLFGRFKYPAVFHNSDF